MHRELLASRRKDKPVANSRSSSGMGTGRSLAFFGFSGLGLYRTVLRNREGVSIAIAHDFRTAAGGDNGPSRRSER